LCYCCDCVIYDLNIWYLWVRVFNAVTMELAAMNNLSVEDNCGIG
jgi:hypothetical protein